MDGIFISDRRDDSAGYAGLLPRAHGHHRRRVAEHQRRRRLDDPHDFLRIDTVTAPHQPTGGYAGGGSAPVQRSHAHRAGQ
ncbi:hypothetical protein [Hydrogenophaga palleronii]|uniref:hypothetical protein n=1 Tax=Hydrogenophaga palleronii TaxID=65655 RepID=UPI0012EE39F5|nr:hypothetical protein [Hydrogenophaga palleronii]